MLAQLNSLDGVAESGVEASGQYFTVHLSPGADPSAVASAAASVLGDNIQLPPELQSVYWKACGENGEIWFNAETLISLSLIEARILTREWGAAAAAHAGLEPGVAERFLAVLYRELAGEFKVMHARGGATDADWYLSRFAEAFEWTLRNMEAHTSVERLASLRESLEKSLAAKVTSAD